MILDVTIAAGDDYVSDVSAFKVRWWRDRYFTGEQAHFWPEELEDCPTWQVNPAYQLVTRDRVFAIAATDGPHRHVRTAAAAYVWGVGKSAYQIGWLARAFTTDPAAVERNSAVPLKCWQRRARSLHAAACCCRARRTTSSSWGRPTSRSS
jgi:hypothetical protein